MISNTVSLKIEDLPVRATQVTKEALAISGGQGCKDFGIGPIWNHLDATVKCPKICKSYDRKWNGNWKTVVFNKLSVCGCCK